MEVLDFGEELFCEIVSVWLAPQAETRAFENA